MRDAYKITTKIEPLPLPDPMGRVISGLRNAAEFAGYVGEDIENAVLDLLASLERRKQQTRTA